MSVILYQQNERKIFVINVTTLKPKIKAKEEPREGEREREREKSCQKNVQGERFFRYVYII